MKNLLIFSCAVAFALGLNACSHTAVDPVTSTGSARSSAIDSLTTGGPHSFTTIAVSSLPVAVTTYITTNYAGATIKDARQNAKGEYLVAITVNSTIKVLSFKADGTFVKELTARPAKDDSTHHAGPNSLTTVAVSSLPTAITTYITTNYAGATIKEAAKDATGNYLVGILVNSNVKVLSFKADGTFLKAVGGKPMAGDSTNHHKPTPGDTTHHTQPGSTTVAVSSLPAAIGTYISTNYSGATIERAGQEGTNKDYVVSILTADKKRVLLLFGSDGTFIKVLTHK